MFLSNSRTALATHSGTQASLTYLSHFGNNRHVAEPTIRTSLDIPQTLHRRLHEAAARKGSSARQIILKSIERAVEEADPRPRRRLRLNPPLVPANGRKTFNLTNEQIYDLLELP
jgi:hypothetical protein